MSTLAETQAGAYIVTIISVICNIVILIFNFYLLHCIMQTKKNTDEILRRMGNGVPYRHREERQKSVTPADRLRSLPRRK